MKNKKRKIVCYIVLGIVVCLCLYIVYHRTNSSIRYAIITKNLNDYIRIEDKEEVKELYQILLREKAFKLPFNGKGWMYTIEFYNRNGKLVQQYLVGGSNSKDQSELDEILNYYFPD